MIYQYPRMFDRLYVHGSIRRVRYRADRRLCPWHNAWLPSMVR